MRQNRDGQPLLTDNVLSLRGGGGSGGGGGGSDGGGTQTSGSDYGPTPRASTSYSRNSGGVGINNTISFTAAQKPQQQQKPYCTLSGTDQTGFGPTHMVDSTDGGQVQVQVVETLPRGLSPVSQQRARLGRDHSGGHGDMTVLVSITSSNDLQVTQVGVSPEAPGSPRVEEVFVHTDGGRVPDPDAVIVIAPQEVLPSYDSIPGNA
jgi:hypothetical protein